MLTAWIRGGVVAVTMSVAGAAAPAATISDATFDLSGTYAYEWFRYHLDGTFTGSLLGDPTVARDYDLGLTVALSGETVFDDTLSLDGPFSIADAAEGAASAPGFGIFLGILAWATEDVTVDTDSLSGDVDFALGYLTSTALKFASCFSLFSNGCAYAGDFAVAMNLSYEGAPTDTGSPAPIPLPAGLPLLTAGLGALTLLRRRRGWRR